MKLTAAGIFEQVEAARARGGVPHSWLADADAMEQLVALGGSRFLLYGLPVRLHPNPGLRLICRGDRV